MDTAPIEITFKNMEASPSVEARIREHVLKLRRVAGRLVRCHVTVESPHRHQHQGQIYTVRILLNMPGDDIVVSHVSDDPAHRDVYVAIRDAFRAARRQVQDHVRIRRGETKHHEPTSLAKVTRLFTEDGYGFLQTPDELEVYFHKNAVTNGAFGDLQPGAKVRYVLAEGEGEAGPQASTVEPLRMSHAAHPHVEP